MKESSDDETMTVVGTLLWLQVCYINLTQSTYYITQEEHQNRASEIAMKF